MWSRLVLGIGFFQVATGMLFQADIIPEGIFNILEQYPPLIAVIIVTYYMYKMQRTENETTRQWLEHMLAVERASLKEVYEGQQRFTASLLTEIEQKQNKMADRIELLTQQVAVNTSTVGEIAKVDTIVSELISRLEKK